MAIFRMFADIVSALTIEKLVHASLDKIACAHTGYAYYGSRRTLEQEVRERASDIRMRSRNCPSAGVPDDDEELIRKWFQRKDWKKESGSFPDFVLEYTQNGLIGDGALVELKDTKDASIASFNSTIPERVKSLSSLPRGVLESVKWYQKAICKPINEADSRDCFYLIRTHKGEKNKVRLSIVHGAFFETVSVRELIRQIWRDLFQQAGISPESYREIVDHLSELARDQIAITRRFDGASIKPRLRIMAEVEEEGNPHTYPEVPELTVNLILQTDPIPESSGVVRLFSEDGVQGASVISGDTLSLHGRLCTVKQIQHKRNGAFLLIQYSLVDRV